MKSNYVIQAEINIAKHPEWDTGRKFAELEQAYKKENRTCYICHNNNRIYIIPTVENKPIKIIYEGEYAYEE